MSISQKSVPYPLWFVQKLAKKGGTGCARVDGLEFSSGEREWWCRVAKFDLRGRAGELARDLR